MRTSFPKGLIPFYRKWSLCKEVSYTSRGSIPSIARREATIGFLEDCLFLSHFFSALNRRMWLMRLSKNHRSYNYHSEKVSCISTLSFIPVNYNHILNLAVMNDSLDAALSWPVHDFLRESSQRFAWVDRLNNVFDQLKAEKRMLTSMGSEVRLTFREFAIHQSKRAFSSKGQRLHRQTYLAFHSHRLLVDGIDSFLWPSLSHNLLELKGTPWTLKTSKPKSK